MVCLVPKVRLDFPFKCDKCKVTYKHKESLVRHIKDECGVKSRVKCTICFQQLAKKDSLRQHMMTKHNMDRSKLEEFENAGNNQNLYNIFTIIMIFLGNIY